MIKLLVKNIAVLAVLLFAGQASAVVIEGTNNPIDNTADFAWTVNSDGQLVVTLANTSNFDALLTGFQFDVANGAVSGMVSVTGTLDNGDWVWTTDVTGCSADECLITGTNLNGGNPQAGIQVSNSGVFTFSGDFADPSTITNIMVRFQRTGSDGEGSDRGFECISDCEPPDVPEPGTLMLFGFGLIGLGLASRRRRGLRHGQV
jgi:hypothetical protein